MNFWARNIPGRRVSQPETLSGEQAWAVRGPARRLVSGVEGVTSEDRIATGEGREVGVASRGRSGDCENLTCISEMGSHWSLGGPTERYKRITTYCVENRL